MNIIMAVSSSNRFCGAFRNVYNLSKGLADRDNKVTLLSVGVDPEDFLIPEEARENFNVNILKGHRLGKRIFPFAAISFCFKYLRDSDIIYLNGHRNSLSLVISIFAIFLKIPYVIVPKSTLPVDLSKTPKQRFKKKLYDKIIGRWIIMKATYVGAISNREIKDMREYGISESSIRRVNSGIDVGAMINTMAPGHFRKKYNIQDKYLIVYLGRIDPFKGINHLVEAFSVLEGRKSCSLIIAGPDVGYRPQLEAIVEELGLSKEVFFTGPLEGDEKMSFLRDADLVFYAGRFESFGLVAFESIFSGTPVIVSKNTDCGEMIKKANAGFLVDYGNVTDIKSTIEHIRNHSEESCEKVQNGKEYVEQFMTFERVSADLENTLKEARDEFCMNSRAVVK